MPPVNSDGNELMYLTKQKTGQNVNRTTRLFLLKLLLYYLSIGLVTLRITRFINQQIMVALHAYIIIESIFDKL